MSPTWHSEVPPPDPEPLGLGGWARVVLRGVPVVLLLAGGLLLKLLLRLIERPLCGASRPVTPWITVGACRAALWLMGIPLSIAGSPVPDARLLVANHASWLDILVLNAVRPLYFVSKAEVAAWPGIGLLARATGTVFVSRDRRQAAAQADAILSRLRDGHRLLLFPEGTSTDGRRVLRFHASAFAGMVRHLPELLVQPVAIAYHAPPGRDPRFFGWWGEMELGAHLLQVLSAAPQGRVTVELLQGLRAGDAGDRKALAAALEAQTRTALTRALA